MGLFGGDGSPDSNRANDLLEEQMRMNKVEIAQKRQDLYEQKMDVLKAQGGESWVPDRTPRNPMGSGLGGGSSMPPGIDWPFGKRR